MGVHRGSLCVLADADAVTPAPSATPARRRYTLFTRTGGAAVAENQNSKTAQRVRYRPGPFTRINLLLGVATYSVLPILVSWPAIHAHRITMNGWKVMVAEVALLQVALWYATVRCGSQEFPFWEGAAMIARYLRTGWLYTDVVAGGIGVCLLLIISDLIALTPKPRSLYYRMRHALYRNRLVQ